jgi:hypothetical protein
MNKSQPVVCVFVVNGALERVGPSYTRLETSHHSLTGSDEGKSAWHAGFDIVQKCTLLLIYIREGLLTLSQLSNAEVDILRSTKSQT